MYVRSWNYIIWHLSSEYGLARQLVSRKYNSIQQVDKPYAALYSVATLVTPPRLTNCMSRTLGSRKALLEPRIVYILIIIAV